MALTAHDQTKIAAEATVDPRTVRRIYAGARSASTTRARVNEAASRLGYPLPPEPPTSENA
jgi:DNA-binding LacI/PurR family transcriptional regulator